MRNGIAGVLALVLFATPACAQQPERTDSAGHGHDTAAAAADRTDARAALPEGWRMRLDNPEADAASIAFTPMSPGWHVTTGPAAIFWQPEVSASGDYTVSSTIFQFKASGPREAFGIFVGGQDLEPEKKAQSYLYFVIRGDGRYLIKRRNGPVTSVIRDWTEHPAIQPLPTGDAPSRNTLAIDVAGDSVSFTINGQQVESLARADYALDGHAGLRVNHRLNLHVGDFTVAEKLGPGR